MKFMAGEQVLAKPPNIDEFQKGKILMARGDKYVIQFESGKEHTVLENNIQPERPSRSTARTIKGKLYKSPLRKSPGRKSPSRRSPSRRSPGRRSPGRSPGRPKRLIKITPKQSDDEKSFKTDSQSTMSESDDVAELMPLQSRLKDQSAPTATRRSVRILNNMLKDSSVSLRGIDRAVSLPVERKAIMYDYLADTKERGFSVQREPDIQKLYYEEEVLPDSSTTEKTKKKEKEQEKSLEIELVSKPQEWLGWIGAICLTILLPCAIILPQISCQNNKCLLPGLKFSTKLQSYFNLYAALAYISFLLVVALSSFLPLGSVVDGMQMRSGKLQYRLNGAHTLLLVLVSYKTAEIFGIDITNFIIDNLLRFSVLSWITGTILSIALFIKGGRIPVSTANIYGSTNNFIYDFWQGREINPRVLKLDIKMLLSRVSVIGTMVIIIAVMLKSSEDVDFGGLSNFKDLVALKAFLDLNPTIMTVGLMLTFYCFDYLYFEDVTLTSFRVLYEGTGYMTCVAGLIYPFLVTLGPRYLLAQEVNNTSPWMLGFLIFVFCVGYFIYRFSNLQKNNFRRNPFSQESLRLETLSTNKGKKIIISGFWGLIRHPNYLGDILMNWAMVLVTLNNDLVLYWSALCCTLVLAHRALRDNSRCHKRYGAAWENYCLRVRSLIFKRIF
ncbi:hypothetical protein G9C98_002762 [Cotesia typhae]|uniref:Uncharacterized protein n=1 Tax=Cotesia typhae TaxID=2053667 RepID=A0A8J5RJT5_9HYME|nr:hypothetical protein G9C98_002762 [Cotesia typhae]